VRTTQCRQLSSLASEVSSACRPESTATQFNVTPAVVQAWESGSLAVPDRVSNELAWRTAASERTEALRQSGLPECSVLSELNAKIAGRGTGATLKELGEIVKHTASCPVCQARDKYLTDRFPPLPPRPQRGTLGAGQFVMARVQRLPSWARPAAYGGIIIGGYALVRGSLMMVSTGPSWHTATTIGLAVLGGIYLGAVGGGIYTLVRPWSRRFGRVGDYVTGLACVYAYAIAIAIPAAALDPTVPIRDPAAWVIAFVLSTVFGLVIGRSWFRTAGG
jgi:hypothetical protein